ncbi:MAG: site-specific DNA-methyltransferase [Kiloniellales bacterium]
MENKLYFGDNLDIMREYVPDESVDLVYLDPPFNSQAQYNVLFEHPDSTKRGAQAGAFVDAWSWGEESELSMAEVMSHGGVIARMLDALRSALGQSDLMAYLAMMTPRLIEMRRVLKTTGTLYLHCDPTASHYLKVLLDSAFTPHSFRNEIVWRRSPSKGLSSKRLPTNHDLILAYTKGSSPVWNDSALFLPYDESQLPEKVSEKYSHEDRDGRRYQLTSLINPNSNRPNLTYEFLGVTRVWRWTKERMQKAYEAGIVVQTAPGRVPRMKRYLDEQRGLPLGDVWTDIAPLNSQSQERVGYPTQKPRQLLDRIIAASSDEGSVILDPFCGCGTTIESAQCLGRQWIGIDIAIHAIKVIESRLKERLEKPVEYRIEGIPRDYESAVKLAERDKYQFQWWANYLFNPHALREQKKGADRGVDGEMFFPNGPGRPWGRMLTSVKGGATVGPAMVRDFRGTMEREGAELGLFICLQSPTRAMTREAAAAGLSPTVHEGLPRLQIVSIREWFEGNVPKLPPLEHLPTAAFASNKRRRPAKGKRPDPQQPEFKYTFSNEKDVAIHLNPVMVSEAKARQVG